MAEEDLILKARTIVLCYANDHLEGDEYPLELVEVRVYRISNVLHNWTILVTTAIPNDTFYEVTLDKLHHQTRLCVYKKTDQLVIPDT